MENIAKLRKELEPYYEKLMNHPVYESIDSIEKLQTFMEHHVYAVWDFMSLLKSLQRNLTGMTLPWRPVGPPEVRYLINEIVLGEECDVDSEGIRQSHFEMYVEAMEKAGADTGNINAFMDLLNDGATLEEALANISVPKPSKDFVNQTFELIAEKQLHKQAAAFTFGREDLIPDMFIAMVKSLGKNQAASLNPFIYYLERHIEVDGGEHSGLAMQMTSLLCGDDEQKWKEAKDACIAALSARIALWDAVLKAIETEKVS